MPGRILANEWFGTLRPDNFLHVDRTHLKGVSADREGLDRGSAYVQRRGHSRFPGLWVVAGGPPRG